MIESAGRCLSGSAVASTGLPAAGARLLSLGEALVPGDYRVHSRFERVTNFVGPDNRLASVVGEAIGPGPVNLVLTGSGPWPWDELTIWHDAVELAGPQGTALWGPPPFCIAQSQVDARLLDPAVLSSNVRLAERLLAEAAPAESLAFLLDRGPIVPLRRAFDRAFAERARGAARLVREWNLVAGVAQLKGCGYGLTPSGDDFACGVAAALDLLERGAGLRVGAMLVSVCVAGIGENVLSNTFLDLAGRGLQSAPHKAWVEALAGGGPAAVGAATTRLLGVGETSGADFAVGFVLTCRAAEGRQVPASR